MEVTAKTTGRITLFALLLLSFAFATVTPVNDVDLYTVYTDLSRFRVTNDFDFSSSVSVGTAGKVLSGGSGTNIAANAVICPSTVTVSSGISGLWASDTFDARYAYAFTCVPASQSRISNQLIRWNTADYNAMRNFGFCYPEDSCWGHEGSLVSQQVDYETLGTEYLDRLGYANSVCKGTNTIRMLNRAGSFVGTTGTEGTDGSTPTQFSQAYTLTEGLYQAQSRFQVQGCAVVIRPPACQGDQEEAVYSRTQARSDTSAPEFTAGLPQETLNFEVRDVQYSADDISSTPSSGRTLCMQPGETRTIQTTVKNTGDANDGIVEVYTVSATGGFTTQRLGGGCIGLFCIYDGFEAPIAPVGRTNPTAPNEREVLITLRAPSSLPSGLSSTGITYRYRPTELTCSAAASKPFFVSYTINGTPGCVEEQANRCMLSPASTTVNPGESEIFFISCLQEGAGEVSCGTVNWNADATLGPTIEAQSNTQVQIRFDTPSSNGMVTATTGGYGSCTADVAVRAGGTRGCVLTPNMTIVNAGVNTVFDVRCVNYDGSQSECNSVRWSADSGLGAAFAAQSSTQATVRFNSPGSNGALTATSNWGVCTADVTVRQEGLNGTRNACVVTPGSVTVDIGDEQLFALDCFSNFSRIPCTGANWNADAALDADFLSRSDSAALIQFNGAGGSSGSVDVNVPSFGYFCDSNITIFTEGLNVTQDGCTINPSSATLERGDTQLFGIGCRTGGNIAPCTGVAWDADSNLQPIFIARGNGAATVQFNGENQTGNLHADVVSLGYSCNSAITLVPEGALGGNGTCTGIGCEGTGPTDQTCKLSTTALQMLPGGRARITLRCPLEPSGECTGAADWNIDSLDGIGRIVEEIGGPPEGRVLEAVGEGQGYLIVEVPNSEGGTFACHTLVTIGGLFCGDLV